MSHSEQPLRPRCPLPLGATRARYPAGGPRVLPAEIQEGPGGGGHPLVIPAQEVELCHCASLAGLQVLQVEAPHEEILAPDVLRDQMHLCGGSGQGGGGAESTSAGGPAPGAEPLCGEGAGTLRADCTWQAGGPSSLPSSTRFTQKVTLCFCCLHVTQGQNSQIIGKKCVTIKMSPLSVFSKPYKPPRKFTRKKLYFRTKTQTGFYSQWPFIREAPPSCRKTKPKGSYRRCQAVSAGSPGRGPQNHDQLRGEHPDV